MRERIGTNKTVEVQLRKIMKNFYDLNLAGSVDIYNKALHSWLLQGGLTTPTCDEVVQWTVFPTTVPISEAQLNIFRYILLIHIYYFVGGDVVVSGWKAQRWE